MSEGSPAGGSEPDDDEWVLLVFAGLACLLAAVNRSQPEPVVVFGAAAGAVGLAVVAVDLLSEYAPGLWAHLAVGGGALLAAGFAAPGRHYVNVATFGAAAALVLWRVFDLEYRGAS
jgi:hypothetical protein